MISSGASSTPPYSRSTPRSASDGGPEAPGGRATDTEWSTSVRAVRWLSTVRVSMTSTTGRCSATTTFTAVVCQSMSRRDCRGTAEVADSAIWAMTSSTRRCAVRVSRSMSPAMRETRAV
ncbi:hypothetical protein ACFQV2_32060 [Actinokineospora soli]|uniref:Uncharacterized protein n=1 Tax=Actinokineospora soli TaxID=1048753 RepID=A0ABW2TX16_9PSEU